MNNLRTKRVFSYVKLKVWDQRLNRIAPRLMNGRFCIHFIEPEKGEVFGAECDER